MPLDIRDDGQRNDIYIDETLMRTGSGRVHVSGNDNRLRIAEQQSCASLDIQLSGGSRLDVAEDCNLGHLTVFARDKGDLRIGSETTFDGRASLFLHEPGRITVGQRCLLGGEFTAMNSDMHSIMDLVTQLRVNPPADVVIGDHVWIGAHVTVLKGSAVGGHSVIGFGATVAGRIPSHCLASGIPARVMRSGITWRHDLVPYEKARKDATGTA